MSKYYSVNEDKEFLYAMDPDEAIVEWLESDAYNESLETLPDTVTVYEWELKGVKPDSICFDWAMESLLENVDENHTYDELVGEYEPSEAVIEAFRQFKEEFCKDFKPTILYPNGNDIKIDLKKWISDNRWFDDER